MFLNFKHTPAGPDRPHTAPAPVSARARAAPAAPWLPAAPALSALADSPTPASPPRWSEWPAAAPSATFPAQPSWKTLPLATCDTASSDQTCPGSHPPAAAGAPEVIPSTPSFHKEETRSHRGTYSRSWEGPVCPVLLLSVAPFFENKLK